MIISLYTERVISILKYKYFIICDKKSRFQFLDDYILFL
jgi:hypothetical protein